MDRFPIAEYLMTIDHATKEANFDNLHLECFYQLKVQLYPCLYKMKKISG